MGLVVKMREFGERLDAIVRDPKRVQRYLEHFNQLGMTTHIDWLPEPGRSQIKTSYTDCLGRLRFDNAPLDYFELERRTMKWEMNERFTETRITFTQHFILDSNGRMTPRIRCRRAPRRRFGLFGRVTGHVWKGDLPARNLGPDEALGRMLDDADFPTPRVRFDRKAGWIRIIRDDLEGHVANAESFTLGSFLSGEYVPIIKVNDELPDGEMIDVVCRLAERIREGVWGE